MERRVQENGSPRALTGRLARWWSRVRHVPAIARSLQAVVTVAAGLRTEPIALRAAALTYLTVLAVVPLLTVILSVSQWLLGRHAIEARLRDFMLQNLAVGAQATVAPYVEKYVQRASRIGGAGFLLLLFSSISLLVNIEKAFNHIFRVTRPRRLAVRAAIYACLITLGPLLLALSLASTAFLAGAAARRPPHFFVLGPLLVTYAAFTLLYLILPSARVRFRPALAGALVAGTVWEIAKVLYAEATARSVRNDAIYGSLSAIPVFLVWTYLSWIIVLFGARLAFAAQATHPEGAAEPAQTPLDRELLAVRVMRAVAAAFDSGAVPPSLDRLAAALPAVPSDVGEALARLNDAGLAREANKGSWVPARPLSAITLADVRAAARSQASKQGAHEPQLVLAWARADAAAGRELTLSLEELLQDSRLSR